MHFYRILRETLQNYEKRFADAPRFVPNLLRFREYPYSYHGIYDEDRLIGTFILHPYSEVKGHETFKILRVERPLLETGLSNRKRSEAFKGMKDYISDLGSKSCNVVEMELYERIDDEIFFPSSLAVVGTFNLAQDFNLLVDWSFETIHSTLCFELTREDEPRQSTKGRSESSKDSHKLFAFARKPSDKPSICYSGFKPLLERERVLQPSAFNLPEYCLIRKQPYLQIICWFPDLFLLSKNNWKDMIGYDDEVCTKILNIDRGKIYLTLGFNTKNLLEEIDRIWTTGVFLNIKKFQIFSSENYRRDIMINNGKIVHSIKLLRKYIG